MSGGLEVFALKEEDIKTFLACSIHLGTQNVDHQMERCFHYQLEENLEKLLLAARAIAAIERPADVCVVSTRSYGHRAVLQFASAIGATPIAGRFTPGTFTNEIQSIIVSQVQSIMAEVRRYSGQSYSKVHKQESAASKAFDDIIAKAKAANVKWRNTSYVKPTVAEEAVSKKHKVDIEESNDSFSFEFDSNKSSRKKKTRYYTKTIVLQPSVGITSVASTKVIPAFDNTDEEDVTVTKGNVRTYSKGGGIKIKIKQEDTIQIRTGSGVKPRKKTVQGSYSTNIQGTPQLSSQETIDGPTDGLYIKPGDYDSTGGQDAYNFFLQEEEEQSFKRPKQESSCSMDGEVTVKFCSPCLSPVVYQKFTENVKPEEPAGYLSNSKVVYRNVLKHDSGTTPIVVCSPKVGNEELKQSNMHSKFFKDNSKDPLKSRNIPAAQVTKGNKSALPKTPKEKDPFDLDDDLYFSFPTAIDKSINDKTGSHNVISSPTIESHQSQCSTITRYLKTPDLKTTDIEEIVKSVKQTQPRKYHRIFRSRNKGFMEQHENCYKSSINGSTDKTPDNVQAMERNETSGSHPQTDMHSQQNGESQDTENEMEVARNTTQESHQDYGSTIQVLPQLINLTGDKVNCDLGNSLQSDINSSQSTEATSISQELEPQAKKFKVLKPPPAERKIFRARTTKPSTMKKIFSSPKKCVAVYNVRSWQDDDEEMSEILKVTSPFDEELCGMFPDIPPEPPKLKPVTQKQIHEPKAEHTEMPSLKRAVHWQGYQGDNAFTSVHVGKQHRDLFTVVKNVKEAHECQEHGETQEFDDDIEYLLAGIESTEPMSTRCLSCVGRAQKSTIPAFRMHLRAHGTITNIFSCLQDAASDPSLALCTSALMFMLSRDRLNMDLDRESLNLMLRLLVVDQQEGTSTTLSTTADQALKKNKDRVQQVYQEFLSQSEVKPDAVESKNLSTGNLALESLLSLTSHQAGEWFKEELRTLGALDHIVNTVCLCVASICDHVDGVTSSIIDILKKVDRSLRVLETVTYLNAENQNYVISCKDSSLIPSLNRALKTCQTCLSIYPLTETSSGKVDKESFGWVVYSTILAILRVLLNLSHENDIGCKKIGEQPVAMETVLLYTLQSPQYVPTDCRFDLYVLSLGLLVNLVEHCDDNRSHLLTMQTLPMYQDSRPDTLTLAYMSLIEVFICKEAAAQQLEQADESKTPEESSNNGGGWQESDCGMEWVADSTAVSLPAVKKGLWHPGASENQKGLNDEETFTIALHRAGKHMENSIVAAYVALLIGCLTHDSPSGSVSTGGNSIQRVIQMLEKL